ncbi:MAG: hypothetical protein R3F17_16015 [Planctomycetota bacterium]
MKSYLANRHGLVSGLVLLPILSTAALAWQIAPAQESGPLSATRPAPFGTHAQSVDPDGGTPVPMAPARTLPTSLPGAPMALDADEPDPGSMDYAPGTAAMTQVAHDLRDGTLWGLGHNYKASFDARGFTFIPFLGSDAEHNWPLSLSLDAVTYGGERIELQAGGSAVRTGDRWSLDRGAVDVVYDLSLDGVEQSFVLDVTPSDRDLTLTLDVQSELQPQREGDGWSFATGRGGVTYQHALVYDAAGHQLDLDIDMRGGDLQLTVPAEFMRSAVAPVVVDPFLATFQVYGGYPHSNTHPDVAYIETSNRFAFCYQSAWSATDRDACGLLRGQLVHLSNARRWTSPRRIFDRTGHCSNQLAGQFMVASPERQLRQRGKAGPSPDASSTTSAPPSWSGMLPRATGTFRVTSGSLPRVDQLRRRLDP